MLPWGINNLTRETQTQIREIQSAIVPPKKKRPKTTKPNKKGSDDDEGELFGTRIEQQKTQLVPPDLKKQYKYWKPWLEEAKLPDWAEKLMDQPTYVQLSDKNPPNIPKRKRQAVIDMTKTVDVENVSVDYSKWKVNDLI